jgi:hypothetical protein
MHQDSLTSNSLGIPVDSNRPGNPLGHVDGHLRGVAGVYNKSIYTEQKRMALALWADHVQGVCDDGAMAQPRRRGQIDPQRP